MSSMVAPEADEKMLASRLQLFPRLLLAATCVKHLTEARVEMSHFGIESKTAMAA
jgi:hypothetical protein